MKLPSLEQVWKESTRTLQRFPVVMACAAIGTVAAVVLANEEIQPETSSLFQVILPAVLGIPMLTSLALIAETRLRNKVYGAGMQLIGVLLLAAYGMIVPTAIEGTPLFHVIRFQLFLIALLFLLAVSPYVGKLSLNGFWNFNKTLVYRILTAALFSLVLFAGLALALAALDNLFGVDIPGQRYLQLWILVIGIFAIWFFLAGIPEDFESLDRETDYPKVIKAFAQYILFPVVVIYLLILYAYVGKITLAWSWPQGWVSRLILGFSITGLLSLILLNPIRDRLENLWIKKAWRWFFVVLAPLTVVLWLAVMRRVSDYGVTESRYAALAYAVWLAAMVVYFLFSRTKSIKVIPWSLCIFTLVISTGPWGIFRVSEASQIKRLENLLIEDSILVNGSVQKASGTVAPEDRREISAIIGYLGMMHGYDGIQPWFHESLKQDSLGARSTSMDPIFVTKLMGIVYDPHWQAREGNVISFSADRSGALSIDGYQHLLVARTVYSGSAGKEYTADAISYRISGGLDTLTFYSKSDNGVTDSLPLSLRPLIDRLLHESGDANEIPPEAMSVSSASDSLKVKIGLQRIQLRLMDGEMRPDSYEAEIMYSTGIQKQ